MATANLYTACDDAKLRALYPEHGAKHCASVLGRTEASISHRVRVLGVKRDNAKRMLTQVAITPAGRAVKEILELRKAFAGIERAQYELLKVNPAHTNTLRLGADDHERHPSLDGNTLAWRDGRREAMNASR